MIVDLDIIVYSNPLHVCTLLLHPIKSYRKYISFAPSPSRANAYFRSRNIRLTRSLTSHLAKRKKNRSKMWQLRPTKVRIHLASLLASKQTSMRKVQTKFKKHISYINLLASCSNLTHLSSSSPILKTIWSQRDIIQVPTVHPYHTLFHSIPF